MMKQYAKYLLRQFNGLADAARELSRGNYQHRAPVISADEIGHIAASFNATADAILAQEAAVARAERSRRFLAAGVLHDLRAPLGAMRGFLELLRRSDGASKAESERFLGTVGSCVLRQRRFLESLQELSEVDVAEDKFNYEHVDLAEVIRGIVELLHPRAIEKEITLSCATAEIPPVYVDVFWLTRAITNVVVNAINYTPRGGEVQVSLRKHNGKIEVVVKDNGIGIAPTEVDRIFEHFFRASSGVASAEEGSGLGLSVVKKVLERHRGAVSVQSVLGGGTTFTLSLPLAETMERELSADATRTTHDAEAVSKRALELLERPKDMHSLMLSKPEFFLTVLSASNLLTAQLLSSSWWPSLVAAVQLLLLRLSSGGRILQRYFAALLPLHAILMGVMFLFLHRGIPTAGRSLVSNSVMLGTVLVLGFAPVSWRIKACYALLSIGWYVIADLWFKRFELVAVGIVTGALLGAMLLIAFKSKLGRDFRIRFTYSFAALMSFFVVCIGYEAIVGISFLSDAIGRDELKRELPYLKKLIAEHAHATADRAQFEQQQLRLIQYNPSISGWAVTEAFEPIAPIGDRGIGMRSHTASWINRAAMCATDLPVGLRLTSIVGFSQCEEFSGRFLHSAANFIFLRVSERTDNMQRKQLEVSVAESLTIVFSFLFLGIRGLGMVLHRSVSRPLRSLLEAICLAREARVLTEAQPNVSRELLEVQSAFNDMVEVLWRKQAIVASADKKLKELIAALLRAVSPFNARLSELLSECSNSLRSASGMLPEAAVRELLSIVERETTIVEELFLLTKLDLGELVLDRGLFTVEELFWGVGSAQLALPDGTLRKLNINIDESDEFFHADSRHVLKLLQLCAEEIHQTAPQERELLIHVAYQSPVLSVHLALSEEGAASARSWERLEAVPLDSIRLPLIVKLAEALGGEVHICRAPFGISNIKIALRTAATGEAARENDSNSVPA